MNRNSIQTNTGWKFIATVFATVVLTACGGGGGGGSDPVEPPSAPPPQPEISVTGSVTKGPVNGATVQFFTLDGRGNAVGAALASTTTDVNGSFSVSLPAGSGSVLVATGGGSFVDESDQEPNVQDKRQIQLASNQGFISILPEGSTVVAINPYTHALVARARFLSEQAGGFLTFFDNAKSILDSQAGFDVLSTIPANPTAPDASATVAQKQYALLLGGMANAINKVSIQLGETKPSYDVIIAVTADFVDGTLDGKVFGNAIIVDGTTSEDPTAGTGPTLPSNIILDTEVTRFRNNNFSAYDGIAVPSIETTLLANIETISLFDALPSVFFLAERDTLGDGIGEDFDGGAKITLNDDGTGTILAEDGIVNVTYTVTGDVLRINFPDGFVQDDFDEFIDLDGDGTQEQFLVTEFVFFVEIVLIEDLINADVLNLRSVGTTTFEAIGHNFNKATEPFDEEEVALAFDYARQIPFNVTDGYQRTLLFNAFPQFPNLFFGDELYPDEFIFNVDGSGSTFHNNISFTWAVNADGHLSVLFANGESAEYFHLATRSTGDIVSVEYTTTDAINDGSGGNLFGDASLSFLKDNNDPVSNTLNGVAGIYSGIAEFTNSDFVGELAFRLNPDGTGVLEFDFDNEGKKVIFTSGLGICWSVNTNGIVKIDRVFAERNTFFPGSKTTSPTYCSNPPEGVLFGYELTQFDVEGAQYKALRERFDLQCDTVADPNCTPVLTTSNFQTQIFNKEVLSNVPPLLQDSSVVIPPGGSITVDVLANAIIRDLAIDPNSVFIDRGPFDGSITINASNGSITYTANEFTEGDTVQYRVRDTSGNLSTVGTIEIIVNPPPEIPADQFVLPRDAVTLSAGVDPSTITSYDWQQISGPNVNIDNAQSASPTFFAPIGGSLVARSILKFAVTLVDNNGVTTVSERTVLVRAAIPSNAYTYEVYNPPFQFGTEVAGGQLVFLSIDGTGAYQDATGVFQLNWFETQGRLVLDFNGTGDFPTIENNFFLDTDGDGFEELFLRTSTITSFEYSIPPIPVDSQLLVRRQLGRVVEENVTFNIQVSDEATDFSFGQTMVGVDQGLPFNIIDGQVLSLPTNISQQLPEINAGPSPEYDELTFNIDGSGSSKRKVVSFTWEIAADNKLVVNFSDGEVAIYSLLDQRSSGDVVGVEYFSNDSILRTTVSTVLTQDPATNWNPSDVAGIYRTRGRTILEDGSTVEEVLLYRIHPDGRGVLELPFTDFQTGEFLGIGTSGFGICWDVDVNGNFIWSRTFTRDQFIPGTSLPAPGHCEQLTNDQTFFRRENVLYDINSQGQLRTIGQNEQNICLFSGDPNCDATVLDVTSYFHRVFDKEALVNNPPLAVPEETSVSTGSDVIIDILANDINGDVAIDATTVEIIKASTLGTLSVDPSTGVVTYTAGSTAGFDYFQYRVRDVNGNLSTYGEVTINVSGSSGLSSLSFLDPNLATCVTASGAASVGELTTLSCDSLGITDLSGIDQLTALTSLSINLNNITSVDLSQNPNLIVVSLQVNSISSVTLGNNSALRTLDVSTNQLSFIDLSGAPLLDHLALDRNQFTSINLNDVPNLTTLSLIDNQLANVDLTHNPLLTTLRLGGNLLTSVDLSVNTQLTHLSIHSNSLSVIDLSGVPNLVEAELFGNVLTNINVNSNPLLVSLDVGTNNLTSVSVDQNLLLEELFVDSNQLTDLDVTVNTALIVIDLTTNAGFTCSNINQIQSEHSGLIDFRFDEDCTQVSSLTFPDTNLSSCVSATGALTVNDLTTLSCDTFGISDATGIGSLTALTNLDLKHNSIPNIDLTNLKQLTVLNLFDNQLTSIDVSNNDKLTSLDVFTNQISTISLANNPLLTLLGLGDNQFSSVDLSVQTLLEQLFLSDNMLLNLDLTANTALTSVDINNNPGISCDDIATIQTEHPLLSLTFNESCPAQ